MKVLGRVRFSPSYLEYRLYSYICHLRQNPAAFTKILEERGEKYPIEKPRFYEATYLDSPIEFKEDGRKCVEEGINFLTKQKYVKVENLVPDPILGLLCRYKNLEDSESIEEVRKIYPDAEIISIPFRHFHETSQQILFDMFLCDGDSDRKNRSILFSPSCGRIGIGFYPFKLSRYEMMNYKSNKSFIVIENKRNKKKKKKKESTKVLIQVILARNKIKETEATKKGGLIEKLGKMKNTRNFVPTLLEFNDPLYLDDNFKTNETVNASDICCEDKSKRKEIRNGMIIEEEESKLLDYKQYLSSLNIGVVDPFSRETRNSLVDEIVEKLVEYFVAFSNTKDGKLFYGFADRERMVDGIVMRSSKFNNLGTIQEKYVSKLLSKVCPKIKNRDENLLEYVKVKSNFKDVFVIINHVKKAEKFTFYYFYCGRRRPYRPGSEEDIKARSKNKGRKYVAPKKELKEGIDYFKDEEGKYLIYKNCVSYARTDHSKEKMNWEIVKRRINEMKYMKAMYEIRMKEFSNTNTKTGDSLFDKIRNTLEMNHDIGLRNTTNSILVNYVPTNYHIYQSRDNHKTSSLRLEENDDILKLMNSEVFENWSHRSSNRVFIILGECGVGKSCLCYYLVHKFIEDNEKNMKNKLYHIYIDIKKIQKEQSVLDYIEKEYEIDMAFKKHLNRRFLFLLDGYDEKVIGNNFVSLGLNDLLAYNSKIIITRRIHFRIDEEKFQDEFSFFQEKPVNVSFVYLHKFEDFQVDAFTRRFLMQKNSLLIGENGNESVVGSNDEFIEIVNDQKTKHKIAELIRNPFLLKTFLEIRWGEYDHKKKTIVSSVLKNRSSIYDQFFRSFSLFQRTKRTQMVPIIDRQSFLNLCTNIACELYIRETSSRRNDNNSIPFSFKMKHVKVIEKIFKLAKHNELICSNPFMVRNDSNRLSFIHKSFAEYFVSRRMVGEISDITKKYSEVKEKHPDEEIEGEGESNSESESESDFESHSDKDEKKVIFSIADWIQLISRSLLNKRIIFNDLGIRNFMKEMIVESQLDLKLLLDYIITFKTGVKMQSLQTDDNGRLSPVRIFLTNMFIVFYDCDMFSDDYLRFSLNSIASGDEVIMRKCLKILFMNYEAYISNSSSKKEDSPSPKRKKISDSEKKRRREAIHHAYTNYLVACKIEEIIFNNFLKGEKYSTPVTPASTSTPSSVNEKMKKQMEVFSRINLSNNEDTRLLDPTGKVCRKFSEIPKFCRSFYEFRSISKFTEKDCGKWSELLIFELMNKFAAKFEADFILNDENNNYLKGSKLSSLRFLGFIKSGNVEKMKVLIDKLSVDPSINENFALYFCCKKAREISIPKKTKLHNKKKKDLTEAEKEQLKNEGIRRFEKVEKYVDISEELLKDRRVDPNVQNSICFHYAVNIEALDPPYIPPLLTEEIILEKVVEKKSKPKVNKYKLRDRLVELLISRSKNKNCEDIVNKNNSSKKSSAKEIELFFVQKFGNGHYKKIINLIIEKFNYQKETTSTSTKKGKKDDLSNYQHHVIRILKSSYSIQKTRLEELRNQAFENSCKNGYLKILKFILETEQQLSKKKEVEVAASLLDSKLFQKNFLSSIKSNKLEIIKSLLKTNRILFSTGKKALTLVTKQKNLSLVELLLGLDKPKIESEEENVAIWEFDKSDVSEEKSEDQEYPMSLPFENINFRNISFNDAFRESFFGWNDGVGFYLSHDLIFQKNISSKLKSSARKTTLEFLKCLFIDRNLKMEDIMNYYFVFSSDENQMNELKLKKKSTKIVDFSILNHYFLKFLIVLTIPKNKKRIRSNDIFEKFLDFYMSEIVLPNMKNVDTLTSLLEISIKTQNEKLSLLLLKKINGVLQRSKTKFEELIKFNENQGLKLLTMSVETLMDELVEYLVETLQINPFRDFGDVSYAKTLLFNFGSDKKSSYSSPFSRSIKLWNLKTGNKKLKRIINFFLISKKISESGKYPLNKEIFWEILANKNISSVKKMISESNINKEEMKFDLSVEDNLLLILCIEQMLNVSKKKIKEKFYYLEVIRLVMEILLKRKSISELLYHACFSFVVEKSEIELIKLFLEFEETKLGFADHSIILNCVKSGHFNILELLLSGKKKNSSDDDFDISYKNNLFLRTSIERGDITTFRVLLSYENIDASFPNDEILELALTMEIKEKRREFVRDVLKNPKVLLNPNCKSTKNIIQKYLMEKLKLLREKYDTKKLISKIQRISLNHIDLGLTRDEKIIISYFLIHPTVMGMCQNTSFRKELLMYKKIIRIIHNTNIIQFYNCIIQKKCTLSLINQKKIHQKEILQKFYRCLTCGHNLKDDNGVCFCCAETCHKGHETVEDSRSPLICFCDCCVSNCSKN